MYQDAIAIQSNDLTARGGLTAISLVRDERYFLPALFGHDYNLADLLEGMQRRRGTFRYRRSRAAEGYDVFHDTGNARLP